MKIRLLLVLFAAIVTLSVPARAALLPEFDEDMCAWNATDIVLVDRDYKVLETWKGSLPAGQSISIGKVVAPGNGEIHWWQAKGLPRVVSGNRLVLFLVNPKPDAPATTVAWKPAAEYASDFTLSTVWIEHGQALAVKQWMNPGSDVVMETGTTELDFRNRIGHIITLQSDLEREIRQRDPTSWKVAIVTPYTVCDVYPAREAAFTELGKCGPEGLAELKQLLQNPLEEDQELNVIRQIRVAAASEAGAELLNIVTTESAYWRQVGPTLAPNWLDGCVGGMHDPREHLLSRLSRIYYALSFLEELHYPPARRPVEELRVLLGTFPDKSLFSQDIQVCDQLLAHLPPTGPSATSVEPSN